MPKRRGCLKSLLFNSPANSADGIPPNLRENFGFCSFSVRFLLKNVQKRRGLATRNYSTGCLRQYRTIRVCRLPRWFFVCFRWEIAGIQAVFGGCLKSQLFKQPRKFGGRESAEFAREFRFLPLFSSISGEKSRKNVAASRREITRRVV